MSIQIMSAVRECGPRELSRYSVLETLANYADDFGFCFPGMEKIAWESRCDERTARRQVVELESEGWLFVTRRVLNGKANVYQINLAKIGVTVPPNAKRSPVFTRLLKAYGDSMTPIFAPEKSADMPRFSEDNPQGVTGHLKPTHRTFEGGSADIACPPNRYNHQEPSMEPPADKKYPLTPLGGVAFAAGVENLPAEEACWQSFLVALKGALGLAPPAFAGGSPHEVQPGQNDFDTCFRDWWLELAFEFEGTWTLVTRAREPGWTRKGLAKYPNRTETLLRERFQVPKQTAVRVIVLDAACPPQPRTTNPATLEIPA